MDALIEKLIAAIIPESSENFWNAKKIDRNRELLLDMEEKLRAELNENQRELLNSLIDAEYERERQWEQGVYFEGLCFGVQLMAATLHSDI